MYSISKLSRAFNLSRSTLLYYDKIGLLKPSKRTSANYRQYSEADKKRLNQICIYRDAGVSLEEIKNLLDSESKDESNVLEKRLNEINNEIRFLRCQQKLIIEMLKSSNIGTKVLLDNKVFTSILKSARIDDETLKQIHVQFEKISPDSHQFFLEFLGISSDEIKQIREISKSVEIIE